MTHTPGPWTATIDDSPYQGPVAYLDGPPMSEGCFHNPADAILAAAAPDLLAALEACFYNHVGWQDKARAAIAKAKGES